MPAHGDPRRTGLSPLPVHAEVNRIGERADLLLRRVAAIVVALREQDAGEQQRGVDRGQLDRLEAPARLHVEEVIEKAAIACGVRAGRVLRGGPEKLQRLQGTVRRLGARDPAVLYAYGIRRQRKADCGDARERRCRPAVGGEAVRRGCQVPEEVEGAVLQGVEKGSCVRRNARAPGVTGTTSEGQGKDDGGETTAASGQKFTSTPSCKRRGSLSTPFGLPKFGSDRLVGRLYPP